MKVHVDSIGHLVRAEGITRRRLPESHQPWIEQASSSWSRGASVSTDEPSVALATYSLFCRQLLLHACELPQLEHLTWAWPTWAPPTQWLDALALALPDMPELAPERLGPSSDLGDLPRLAFEHLIAPNARRALGEFYTPEWLADHLVEQLWEPNRTWVDPTAGSGAFLLALGRQRARTRADAEMLAIDRAPWAALAAAANWAWATRRLQGHPIAERPIPVACADLLDEPTIADSLPRSDIVVGNPPWITWDRLPEEQRTALRPLWEHYGLLAERGMESILGGGKKDLSMLIASVAIDRLLKRDGGRLGFVLPTTLFNSARAARGFRRWKLPDKTPWSVDRVDDFSAMTVFAGTAVRSSTLVGHLGTSTRYPIEYRLWSDRSVKTTCWASPSDHDDPLSAWKRSDERDSEQLDATLGPCDYHAHLGINTGGANGVYWLERIGVVGDQRWRMRNLSHRGHRPIAQITADLESHLLFPILRGKEVRAWHAEPSAWILMVQDPRKRRGLPLEQMREEAPRALDYLSRFEATLRERAAFRRYFQRTSGEAQLVDTGPFYSMFDVGDYTLSPVKVVWNRMGHRLAAAVVTSREGRVILPQETHAMFGLEDESEAHFLAALLNSVSAQRALESFAQVGGKSFATPRSIHRLRLGRFDAKDAACRELATLSRRAHEEAAQTGEASERTRELVDAAAAGYWGRTS
ncbi:N5-glutamine S-adenosyl-L-methionine-dependent methyltransferase [Planctomycetes bacterium Pan216]|uniref:N5-glutamine S-adenosyl-L-methionine-dependent methyltransferase n=1 Tax=Kolteria novifilia TaxID=2527975 RepID=A0A518B1K4_9BACT|nr:N5-glutamine S-adenosyl-L-methionine-dependent methyltransferase [Planctomycetes bacterium Pan216]